MEEATAPITRPGSAIRAPLAGLSALLVFGLLLGSLQAGAAVGESRRATAPDRVAVQELTASLVKAARHLVGSDSHKPCVKTVAVVSRPSAPRLVVATPPVDSAPVVPALLRSALLDLPPPALIG